MAGSDTELIAELVARLAERDGRIEALAAQVEQLTMLLEEARRAGKRQAAPFSKGVCAEPCLNTEAHRITQIRGRVEPVVGRVDVERVVAEPRRYANPGRRGLRLSACEPAPSP